MASLRPNTPSCLKVEVAKIGVTTAPVVGSGSWPAWMARVAMSVLANLALYSADMILGSFRDRSVFEGRTGTVG